MVVVDPGFGMFEKIYCQQVSKPSGTFSVPSTMCTRVSYREGGGVHFPQNYDVIIISTATWVTSPVFWSSQLQTWHIIQTSRDALVSCPSCYLFMDWYQRNSSQVMVRADLETELMFLPPQWLVLVGLSSCADKDGLQLSLVCNLREGAAIYNGMWNTISSFHGSFCVTTLHNCL